MKIAFCAFLAALLVGCSTASPQRYRSADAPAPLLMKEANGVRVSIDAVLDSKRSHKYFSTDTLGKGIVPIFVRVENVSSKGAVLVEKEQFRLGINSESESDPLLTDEVKHNPSGVATATGAAGIVLLSGPLIIASSIMVSTADEVRHNFVDKELRNQSLTQGRSTEGFVYAVLKDRKRSVKMLAISIPVRDLQTDEQTACKFLVKNENLQKP